MNPFVSRKVLYQKKKCPNSNLDEDAEEDEDHSTRVDEEVDAGVAHLVEADVVEAEALVEVEEPAEHGVGREDFEISDGGNDGHELGRVAWEADVDQGHVHYELEGVDHAPEQRHRSRQQDVRNGCGYQDAFDHWRRSFGCSHNCSRCGSTRNLGGDLLPYFCVQVQGPALH